MTSEMWSAVHHIGTVLRIFYTKQGSTDLDRSYIPYKAIPPFDNPPEKKCQQWLNENTGSADQVNRKTKQQEKCRQELMTAK